MTWQTLLRGCISKAMSLGIPTLRLSARCVAGAWLALEAGAKVLVHDVSTGTVDGHAAWLAFAGWLTS